MLGAVGVVALILTSAAHARATAAAPHNLSVDGLDAPIGVGLDDVQFAWQDTVAIQPSYRIVVRSSAGVVWDSGEIASADQSAIPYGGRALAPATV
jgi:hypothetical protein